MSIPLEPKTSDQAVHYILKGALNKKVKGHERRKLTGRASGKRPALRSDSKDEPELIGLTSTVSIQRIEYAKIQTRKFKEPRVIRKVCPKRPLPWGSGAGWPEPESQPFYELSQGAWPHCASVSIPVRQGRSRTYPLKSCKK
jgi:hypothetical protein